MFPTVLLGLMCAFSTATNQPGRFLQSGGEEKLSGAISELSGAISVDLLSNLSAISGTISDQVKENLLSTVSDQLKENLLNQLNDAFDELSLTKDDISISKLTPQLTKVAMSQLTKFANSQLTNVANSNFVGLSLDDGETENIGEKLKLIGEKLIENSVGVDFLPKLKMFVKNSKGNDGSLNLTNIVASLTSLTGLTDLKKLEKLVKKLVNVVDEEGSINFASLVNFGGGGSGGVGEKLVDMFETVLGESSTPYLKYAKMGIDLLPGLFTATVVSWKLLL